MRRTHTALAVVLVAIALLGYCSLLLANPKVERWAPLVTRVAHFEDGLSAPVGLYLGQIHQESGGRENVTAVDLGRGLAQFMDPTARQIAALYPELGTPNPYNPQWAVRAMIKYNKWIYLRVKGANPCERWAATLKGYNAGPGYVQRSQRISARPDLWFGYTEYINSGQSAKNFEYSRLYPRKIIFGHQRLYRRFGGPVCI